MAHQTLDQIDLAFVVGPLMRCFSDEASVEERKKHAVDLTNKYYDLVTDFYEVRQSKSISTHD